MELGTTVDTVDLKKKKMKEVAQELYWYVVLTNFLVVIHNTEKDQPVHTRAATTFMACAT
jgi:hypothetical protein